jgi:hypothetical protein
VDKRRRLAVLLVGPAVLAASLISLPLLAVGGDPAAAMPPIAVAGIPARALAAYQRAAGGSGCPGLRWEVLAGVGWMESRHGGGGTLLDAMSGEVKPWMFGPVLDGRSGTRAIPIGHWAGWWGLDGAWQRAVGPMQFLPATFTAWAVDGDEDGRTNPHDLDDAAPTAARLLCGPSRRIDDERAALLRYNASDSYVADVIAYADALGSTTGSAITCPVAGRTSFTDTWHAPRPDGRVHLGVDMFARAGTPVVAPTAGIAEAADNDVGGLSFRLWGDDGSYYYGAHLASHAAASGRVTAGTILGYVGNTGNARTTPAHLHFEIHPGRGRGDPPSAVNPTPAVALACAANRIGPSFGGGE